jgi:hypothetical protein
MESSDEDWCCFLCQESVIEDMILCTSCSKWAHESCAGYSEEEKVSCVTCVNDVELFNKLEI